jgi:hypothetical protein
MNRKDAGGGKDRSRGENGGVSGAGLEFAGILGITGFLGYLGDGYFETAPLLMIAGIAIGFFYGIWVLFKKIGESPGYQPPKRIQKDSERLDDVSSGMDQIGKRIDTLAERERREGGRKGVDGNG